MSRKSKPVNAHTPVTTDELVAIQELVTTEKPDPIWEGRFLFIAGTLVATDLCLLRPPDSIVFLLTLLVFVAVQLGVAHRLHHSRGVQILLSSGVAISFLHIALYWLPKIPYGKIHYS